MAVAVANPPDAYSAFLMRLGLTSASACLAESLTYPLDILKTRLQLQGELSKNSTAIQHHGALRTAISIVKNEGLSGMYAGLSPALVRHMFYSGSRITIYEQLKLTMQQRHEQQQQSRAASGEQQPWRPSTGERIVLGLSAGGLGQLLAVPADLVKVRMQADGRLVAAGKQAAPRYRGVADAFSKIVSQEGLAGLWRGASPAVYRAALVNLGELSTYDQAKQMVLASGVVGDNAYAHALSSMCSGFVASLVSTPVDVIKTRIMNQDPANPTYRGMLDCLIKTVRSEGVMAMYKGFFPTWARLGPWQLCFWVAYEHGRSTMGLRSF